MSLQTLGMVGGGVAKLFGGGATASAVGRFISKHGSGASLVVGAHALSSGNLAVGAVTGLADYAFFAMYPALGSLHMVGAPIYNVGKMGYKAAQFAAAQHGAHHYVNEHRLTEESNKTIAMASNIMSHHLRVAGHAPGVGMEATLMHRT